MRKVGPTVADLVIDASVTLAWLFEDKARVSAIGSVLGDSTLIAPFLWRLEVVNAILVKERRKQLTPSQGTRFLQILEALDIEVVGDPKNRSMEQLALIARPHQLSAYDAVYLELATATALPLWTYDRNLRIAARRIGVDLVDDTKA